MTGSIYWALTMHQVVFPHSLAFSLDLRIILWGVVTNWQKFDSVVFNVQDTASCIRWWNWKEVFGMNFDCFRPGWIQVLERGDQALSFSLYYSAFLYIDLVLSRNACEVTKMATSSSGWSPTSLETQEGKCFCPVTLAFTLSGVPLAACS